MSSFCLRTAVVSFAAIALLSGPLAGVALAQTESENPDTTDPDVLSAGELVEAPAAIDDAWEDPAVTFALTSLAPSTFLSDGLPPSVVDELLQSPFVPEQRPSTVLASGVEHILQDPRLTGDEIDSAVLAELRLARTIQAAVEIDHLRTEAETRIAALRPLIKQLELDIEALDFKRDELEALIEVRKAAIAAFAVQAFIGGERTLEQTLSNPNVGLDENRVTADQVREQHLAEITQAELDLGEVREQRATAVAKRSTLTEQINEEQRTRLALIADRREADVLIDIAGEVLRSSLHERIVLRVPGTDFSIVAFNAYVIAERVLAQEQPTCGVTWWMLAGIGRIESLHGEFGGSTLDRNGTTTTAIRGPALDGRILDGEEFLVGEVGAPQATGRTETQIVGTPLTESAASTAPSINNDQGESPAETTSNQEQPIPVIKRLALIEDTDGGRYDEDTVFDRAVGPMQFIPQTWSSWAHDTNQDGFDNPQNIYDATVAAGRYLCAATTTMTTVSGQQQAYFAYNHDDDYTQNVIATSLLYRSSVHVDLSIADGVEDVGSEADDGPGAVAYAIDSGNGDTELHLGIATQHVDTSELDQLQDELAELSFLLPSW